MLLGIKARAEGQPGASPWLARIARAGWQVAVLGVLGALLIGRRLAGLLPAAYFAAILLATGDMLSAAAGFIALGLPIAGFTAFGRRWLPAFGLIAAYVLLVLLLAENAYTAFGLTFLAGALLLAAPRMQLASH